MRVSRRSVLTGVIGAGIACAYQKFDCGQTGRSRPILSQWEINHSLVSQDWQKQWQVVGEEPFPP